MKKQNTLAFLVRNLEAWPTEAKHAPVIDGYIWTIGIGGIVLFDDLAMKCQSMTEATINKKEWLTAQLDNVAEKSGIEVKQDAMAKSLIVGIKNGDIDIQPVIDAMNSESDPVKACKEYDIQTKEHFIDLVNGTAKQKIYIAGPMSTHPDFNRPAFNSTSDALSLAGYIVLSPAILPDGLTQAQYMQIDLTMLQCCDAIFMLNNWDDSAGAMAEHALAMKLGLTVIHEVDLC
tara:strand:- start:399 stop:1094 length:696 start_codon:yes stop_codon:yes gene_type:complete